MFVFRKEECRSLTVSQLEHEITYLAGDKLRAAGVPLSKLEGWAQYEKSMIKDFVRHPLFYTFFRLTKRHYRIRGSLWSSSWVILPLTVDSQRCLQAYDLSSYPGYSGGNTER